MPTFQAVTLETVCEGSAKELFARALKEVLDNIQDVNTNPEEKRKISLIFTLTPAEDRASSTIALKCDVKTVPVASIGSTILITKEAGVRKAYANATKQTPLYPEEEAKQPNPVVSLTQ